MFSICVAALALQAAPSEASQALFGDAQGGIWMSCSFDIHTNVNITTSKGSNYFYLDPEHQRGWIYFKQTGRFSDQIKLSNEGDLYKLRLVEGRTKLEIKINRVSGEYSSRSFGDNHAVSTGVCRAVSPQGKAP